MRLKSPGIRASGINREDIFVTTKLAAQFKSYEGAAAAIDASLERMGFDYIDLMIIHSPQPWDHFGEDDRFVAVNQGAWRALEDAYKAGKLRAIGLSNFQAQDIDNILNACTVAPMVNQILVHVTNVPGELIEYSRQQGMLVEAYSPVGHGELFKNESIVAMAEKYNVSVPQLCIRYDLQLGLLPLAKTANPDHMKNNADVDFIIDDGDMDVLNGLETIKDYGEDPDLYPIDVARMRRVIERATDEAGWGKETPKGRGLGLAFHHSFVSYTAVVFDVEVDDAGELSIHRADIAFGCGPQDNPERIRSQMEGACVMGIGDVAITGLSGYAPG